MPRNFVYTIADRYATTLGPMMRSLRRHNPDCTLLLDAVDRQHDTLDVPAAPGVCVRAVPDVQWRHRRMLCKIERIVEQEFDDGDRVFVCDNDLLFQGDVFGAVTDDADVFVTTRHYPYWYPVNGGVWAFRAGPAARQFLRFFLGQVTAPTWRPFVEFQAAFGHQGNHDWWCDQDFLCAIHATPPPIGVRIGDLGPNYNFCPSVEDDTPGTFESASAQILEALGDPERRILHFKGRLKEVLADVTRAD